MKSRLEIAYFPPITWCAAAWKSEEIQLEANENYQKGGFRNRCQIAGPNGPQSLSIPLKKGKNQQTPIREVEISYQENWQQVHWRSIQAAYGRAPFFEHFAPSFEPFFQKKHGLLFDFNLEILKVVFQKMGFPGKISMTETWADEPRQKKTGEESRQEKNGQSLGNPEFSDFRNQFSPKTERFPAWFQPAKYAQVFEERHGFLPGVSVLDLLFCCGKNAGEILIKSYGK